MTLADENGGGSGQEDSNSSPYDRIGAFLLLCCGIFGLFGIVRFYNLIDKQSYESGKKRRYAFIAAIALVVGWLIGVYGTIIFLERLTSPKCPD
jgi:hypothetical protein